MENSKQSRRMRDHLAETVGKMILRDGSEAVSARRAAEEAGCTPATIYNHFRNMDELFWYTRGMLIRDLSVWLGIREAGFPAGPEGIRSLFRTYAEYYLEYPHLYRFFYFHRLDPQERERGRHPEEPDLSARYGKTFAFLYEREDLTPEDISRVILALVYGVNGLLTLYLSGNDPMSSEELEANLSGFIEMILQKV